MIGNEYIDLGRPVSRHKLNDSLVSWWLAINQGPYFGGSRFLDLMNSNHGTLTLGPLWGGPVGRLGGFGRLTFDASDDYVACGTNASLAITGTLTVMCWARFTSGTSPAMVSRWDGAGYILWINTGSAYVGWGDNSSGLVQDATDYAAAINGSWHHFCGTRGSTTSRLYFDGKEGANAANGTLGTSTAQFAIGAYSGGSSGRWGGNIDDVRVWNRELSADEVLAAYNDSRQGYPLTLNRVRPYTVFDTGAAPAGGFRSRIAGGFVVTAA